MAAFEINAHIWCVLPVVLLENIWQIQRNTETEENFATEPLERHHTLMIADRPEAETFAENVGILTHRVFGLEVEEAGFYNLIRDAVIEEADYDIIMKDYEGRIGSEGRGLIRSLIALQNKKSQK